MIRPRLLAFGAGLALALAALSPANAEEPRVAAVAGKVRPAGYCQITVLTSAVALVTASCSTGAVPTEAKFADIIVEGAPVRYRSDGTSPTAALGMPLAVGANKAFALADVTVLKFIQQSATATLDIEFFD